MRPLRILLGILALAMLPGMAKAADEQAPQHLPGTAPLTAAGDLAAQMVAGVDKFLLRELERSIDGREKFWRRDFSSRKAYEKSIEPNRQRLAEILGVVDARIPFGAPELVATTRQAALVGQGENYQIFAVRWPVFRDVHGEGLLLVPKGEPVAEVIAIPDCAQTPEQLVGLESGIPAESQFARRLAESGCRVLVPLLINRDIHPRHPPERQGGAQLTNREFLYRPGFEMGHHLIGYEVQKVLAGVDWFVREATSKATAHSKSGPQPADDSATASSADDPKIGVIGYGEGGMIALYAGALDSRIDATCVSGYFGPRERIWEQPIDRNVFGLLEQFGDAELAAMYISRALILATSPGPIANIASPGGAPATLAADTKGEQEWKRFLAFDWPGDISLGIHRVDRDAVEEFARQMDIVVPEDAKQSPTKQATTDSATRHARQFAEINRDTQQLLAESPYVRAKFMKRLYDSKNLKDYNANVEAYREYFANKVIGRFDYPLADPQPRSRKSYETDKWIGYEVMLDVFPDVFAYGILCLPKDLKPGERRPVVVCQHGLEGRPQDTIGDQGSGAYSAFAGKLAERGFITFAPQNLYIGKDLFRTLQRKANPLGKTLFSVIVPQHQQICNWLASLPQVDSERIAFYGLSYGGKSAMRIPPLVKNYCLSICSADFNDWVAKNASTRLPQSYVWTGEYEIFEWNLGSTFNYSEMAALICPRPFMVERGHYDGVGTDEMVAYEFAKVFHNYHARLKQPAENCVLEVFDGPHKIHGVGTYDFLHKHLNWPPPK